VVDVSEQNVKFNVRDKSQFDLKQVEEAMKAQKFKGCELLSGPELLAKET
jgi:hypothetical protein